MMPGVGQRRRWIVPHTQTLRRWIVAAVACVALAGLAGCQTATPYQPLNAANADAGGYSDHQIESNRFQVSFSGNAVTSRETVERYLLYRAAELTLAQGHDWFEAAGRNTDRKTQTFVEPGFGCAYGPGWCGGFWGPRWHYYRHGAWGAWDPWMGQPLDVMEITKYTATAEIVMHKGPKPADNTNAFDAREVLQHLGQDMRRPSI
jgi:hypothetical protein